MSFKPVSVSLSPKDSLRSQSSHVDHCASFHHIYTDSSLFGLFMTFLSQDGTSSKQMFPHLIHQLSLLLYYPIPENELQRAKNQLKSSLMMALESRSVEVEDLGRQVRLQSPLPVITDPIVVSSQILVHGRKIPVREMCDKIDNVTAESVRVVARRIFGSGSGRKATVVCMGRSDVDDWKHQLRKYGVGY